MARIVKDPFLGQCVTIEDDRVFLWLGGSPAHPYTTKIDVTMPFNIGMKIGSGEFEKVESKLFRKS